MITAYHAKYYALDLAKRGLVGEVDAVGTALFDAQVDLNPHQIEAALVGIAASAERGRITDVEARQRKARTRVFSIEDEVREQRTRLMEELDRRVAQDSTFDTIYRIAWTVE